MKDERTSSAKEVADRFKVNPRTIRKWIARGLPYAKGDPGKPNRFDLTEVARWLDAEGLAGCSPGRSVERNAALETTRRGAGETEVEGVRDALTAAKLEKAQLEARKLRAIVGEIEGHLVRREDVDREKAEKARAFRDGLLAVAPRLAPLVAGMSPEEAESALRDAFEQVLAEFAGEG